MSDTQYTAQTLEMVARRAFLAGSPEYTDEEALDFFNLMPGLRKQYHRIACQQLDDHGGVLKTINDRSGHSEIQSFSRTKCPHCAGKGEGVL